MKYPFLEVPSTSVSRVEEFKGLNKNIRIGEAEFSDTKNMSSEEYPLVSTRRKRTTLPLSTEKAKGIISKDDSLLLLEESDGDTMKLTVKETVEAAEKPTPPEELSEIIYDASMVVKCDAKLTEAYSQGVIADFYIIPENSATWRRWRFNFEQIENDLYKFELKNPSEGRRTGTGVRKFFHFDDISVSSGVVDKDNTFDIYTNEGQMPPDSFYGEGYEDNGGFYIGASIRGVDECISLVVEKVFRRSSVFADVEMCWRVRLSEESKEKVENLSNLTVLSIWYPCIEIIKGIEEDYEEYKERKSELEENNKQAIEQYEKDCRTELFVNEPITAAKAVALKQRAETENELLSVESVNKESIIIMKPHGQITKGTVIDTRKPYILLREWAGAEEKTRTVEISEVTDERHMLSMGANVVILPDKVRVNTLSLNENGDYTDVITLEHSDICSINERKNFSVQVLLCNSEYEPISNPKVGQSTPSGGANGEYWIDTSGKEPVLKIYSTATSIWTRAEAYLKICSYDITQGGIAKGDSVKIINSKGEEWLPEEISFSGDGGSRIVYDSGVMTMPESLQETYGKLERGYIVIKGCLKKGGVYAPEADGENDYIEIKRTMPKMNHIIESCNRLWGCYYGKDENGKNVNEIYACKLGDPANWNCFEGTSMDSYAASVGTDGEFTGSAVFENNPVFFKENCIHRVFGSYPENYQIITQHFPGIEKGSEKSAATVNGILFYKAQDGIYGYDGASSVKVSDKLKERYKNAIGGSYDGVYYVSMEDETGERWLFTYDVSRGIWHRQDNASVKRLLNYGRDLLINTDDGKLLSVDGLSGEKEADFDFLLRSGEIGYSISGKKYITKLTLQMILEPQSRVYVDIRYDGNGDFENVFTTQGGGSRSISLPIRPRRCERFEIKIYGKGEFKLISVEKTLRKGSDVR